MGRQFRHLPSGRIYEKKEGMKVYFFADTIYSVDPIIVESPNSKDFEEIRETVVPPGVVSFKGAIDGTIREWTEVDLSYEQWYIWQSERRNKIHSIKDASVTWTVGERVSDGVGNRYTISSFVFENDNWYATFGDKMAGKWNVLILRKIPKPQPVVSLPDENGKLIELFENNNYWFIMKDGHYKIREGQVQGKWCYDGELYWHFPTKQAAEEFARMNKPVYPAGLVEDAIEEWDGWLGGTASYGSIIICFQKLKEFRENIK